MKKCAQAPAGASFGAHVRYEAAVRTSLAALCFVLLAPSAVSASSAVLLPRTGGTGVEGAAIDEAVDAARMVLENEGWGVHDTADVSLALPARLAACGPDDECAPDLRALLGVDVAVGLRLWGEADRVEHIAVVLTGTRGVGHRAVARVTEESPLPFAMAEALRAAITLWSTGHPPEGARGVDEATHLDREELAWEATALNWFLGGLFVLGSAPMLGYGINTAARAGDCVTQGPVEGTCVERVEFSNGAATFTVLGAITLVTGIAIWIAQPIRIFVQASEESASLTLRGTF